MWDAGKTEHQHQNKTAIVHLFGQVLQVGALQVPLASQYTAG